MTPKVFLFKLQIALRHLAASPLICVSATGVILAILLTVVFPVEAFVTICALAGGWAGFATQKSDDDENPVLVLRSVWGMRRSYLTAFISASSAIVAFLLLLAWMGAFGDHPQRNTFYLCGALWFYAFSASYYLFGRHKLSKARDRLESASVEQSHEWRAEEAMKRKRFLSEIL